jgi:hypothetical protein
MIIIIIIIIINLLGLIRCREVSATDPYGRILGFLDRFIIIIII